MLLMLEFSTASTIIFILNLILLFQTLYMISFYIWQVYKYLLL